MTTEQQLTRAAVAYTAPTTADEATRQVDLVIASGDPVNGQVLTCTPAAVTWGPAPVPILLSHNNRADWMAGRLVDIRFDGGQLVGTAQFTDAPASQSGWELARSGCAVSVGAYYLLQDTFMQGAVEVVKKWRLAEASLVPIGADPLALTRSAQTVKTINIESPPMDTNTQAIENSINADTAEDGELSKAEANRHLQVERSAALAGLTREQTDHILNTTSTTQAGLMEVLKRHAAVVEGRTSAGHPARIFTGNSEPQGLEATLSRAIKGERLEQPLWLSLRAAGIGHGHDAAEVWRSALTGEGRWLARNISTSDLPQLLTATGNRRLMERFAVADSGVRVAASVRRLVDYREAGVIDVGMVGIAKEIKEGGEITFASVDESSAKYKPARFGIGLKFTPESLANDDLQGLDAALSELAAAMLDAEAVALVDLLEGAANGRTAPDGSALFATGHANTAASGGLSIATIGGAVEKLRNMKAIGGRYIAQEPAALLVASGQETLARQLLSSAINANQASAVNPWSNLEIAVDPRLSGNYSYVLGNSRKPLELGRLTDGPVLTTEIQYETDAFRAKSTHVFGAIVQEWRSIVRVPTT